MEASRESTLAPADALPLSLLMAGFSAAQVDQLCALRARYQAGAYEEEPIEVRRLRYARWLYEHGSIGT